jgi:hypothetical protein
MIIMENMDQDMAKFEERERRNDELALRMTIAMEKLAETMQEQTELSRKMIELTASMVKSAGAVQ